MLLDHITSCLDLVDVRNKRHCWLVVNTGSKG
jgi:hypothetical protein